MLSERWDYRRDEAGQIVKANDHYMDAMRYAIFSDVQRGIVVVKYGMELVICGVSNGRLMWWRL